MIKRSGLWYSSFKVAHGSMTPMVRKFRSATVAPAVFLGCLLAGILNLANPQDKPSFVTLAPSSGWQMIASQETDAAALGTWGGDPAVEREYGATSFTARAYSLEGATARALVEQAPDPSSAYGLWTFYRSEGMAPVAGMALTVAGPGAALLVRDSTFIRVAWSAEGLEPRNTRALLQAVAGQPPTARLFEQLPPALPSRGLEEASVKYVLGPVAAARVLPSFPADRYGFEQGAEVRVARYRYGVPGESGGSRELTLAAINYPTPQIARAAFDSINASLGGGAPSGPTAFECRRQDTYVLVVTGADSRAAANSFLDQFKVSKVMTQDEPSGIDERAETLRLVRLLVANGILILDLLIFSLAGGVLVFAGKRLARKWFSGSMLVEGQQGGIITLNLR